MVYLPHFNCRSMVPQQACHSAIIRAQMATVLRKSACQVHRRRHAHQLSLRHAHSCSFCSQSYLLLRESSADAQKYSTCATSACGASDSSGVDIWSDVDMRSELLLPNRTHSIVAGLSDAIFLHTQMQV